MAAIQRRYAAAGRNLSKEAAERELVAQFVAEQLLQNLNALKQFAQTNAFAQFAVRIRRLLARMTGRLGKNADLVKIERLLQRAVREAAKKPAATQSGEVRSSFMDFLSGMANDALLPYDEEMRGYIERRGDFIVDNYDKLVDVVNLAFDNRTQKATCYFGKIPANILEQIKNKIGNLPSDQTLFKSGKEYSIAVTLDGIRHIADEKNLGKEDVLDFLSRLADTVLECDTANFDYYNEPHGQRAPGILLKKSFADGTFVSFSIVSQKKKSLLMQTLYMDKADYEKRKSAKTSPLQNSHGRTPKALNGQTSTAIIHDPSEKNNPQSKSSINGDGTVFSLDGIYQVWDSQHEDGK